MLFEINIKDPSGRPLLRDVFHMDSITSLMDVSTVLLDPIENRDKGKAFELSVRSRKATHIFNRLGSIEEVMAYKNALYDALLAQAETRSH